MGTRFFPFAHAGDKTFWADALRTISETGDEVRVLSIDTRRALLTTVAPHYAWQSMPAIPFFLAAGPHRKRYNAEQREIGAITNYVSKSLTMPRLFTEIREIARRWHPDVVHFMDNLGPATYPFIARLPNPSYVSAVTYDPRYSLYDWGLRLSLEGFDGVAASSDAFRLRLGTMGLAARQLRTVHWGVPPMPLLSPEERAARKRELGLPPELPLVFWSGFLQQTTVTDFRTAFDGVETAMTGPTRFSAIFCFKAQHFRPEYAQRVTPSIRVTSDPETFRRARECADLFLNPVTRRGSILAPPLTWVEALMRGVPILTTPCGGVEEALGSGIAGRVAPLSDLGRAVSELVADPSQLAELRLGARRWAEAEYSLDGAVHGLYELWRSSASGRS